VSKYYHSKEFLTYLLCGDGYEWKSLCTYVRKDVYSSSDFLNGPRMFNRTIYKGVDSTLGTCRPCFLALIRSCFNFGYKMCMHVPIYLCRRTNRPRNKVFVESHTTYSETYALTNRSCGKCL
jgi:hypothetical protein